MEFELIGNISFPGLFKDTVDRFPGKTALETSAWSCTYAELDERVRNLSAGLAGIGVRRGDHVCVWAEMLPDTMLTYYALMRIGAASVMLRTSTPEGMLSEIIEKSDGMLVICPCEQVDMFKRAELPKTVRAIVSMSDSDNADYSFSRLEKLGESMSEDEFKALEDLVDGSDTSEILFTSGTTGIPKMVMISQSSRLNMGRLLAHNLRADCNDKFLNVLPMFHCFSLGANLTVALAVGACVHFPDSRHTADVIKGIRAGCTVLNAVPTQFTVLLKREDLTDRDFAGLRTGMVGGSVCDTELFRRIEERLGVTLVSTLGMTECAGGVTMASLDDDLTTRCLTLGKVLEGDECKITDIKTGETLPDGEKGEFCVRGFSQMKGYYKEPELTAKAMDSEGWFHSGDLAWRDENGNINLAGRIKELIIRCGENISPSEIEAVILTMEQVAAVKVAATPDEIFGEEVCAIVVPEKGKIVTNREIIEHLKGKIELNKIPRYFIYLSEMPLNPVGKPDLVAVGKLADSMKGTVKEII